MKSIFTLFILFYSYNSIAQTITPVLYPQYIQGEGTSNASDDRKVPYACRMQVSGLTPNATYRYYNRFLSDTTAASSNGQGNYILATQSGSFIRVTSATLATAGRYGEFTTDAAGGYTGWFITEPSISIEYFPGTILYFRLILNNGAGGGSPATRLTASTPVTVLKWGSAPTQATGLRAVPNPASIAKNFMILYDNPSGTGRPIAGTFIENDGTDNNANPNWYAPFYATDVDNNNNTWGTIIPNNLAGGIKRIVQHALSDGSVINSSVSLDGTYPTVPSGTISTANTSSGLSALAIAPAFAGQTPVKLLSFTLKQLANNKVDLDWKTATETNFEKFEIEKSTNGVDFYSIGSQNSKGDNSTYKLGDIIASGITYYRLKIIDIDGSYTYSWIVSVNSKGYSALSAFPNPVTSGILTLDHPLSLQGAFIKIIGINGTTLGVKNLQKGIARSTIDMSMYPAGDYILIFNNNSDIHKIQVNKY